MKRSFGINPLAPQHLSQTAYRQHRGKEQQQPQYRELSATELYCPKCKQAMPVRERLLLVLPTGQDLYDYACTQCGESLGQKTG